MSALRLDPDLWQVDCPYCHVEITPPTLAPPCPYCGVYWPEDVGPRVIAIGPPGAHREDNDIAWALTFFLSHDEGDIVLLPAEAEGRWLS